MEKLIDYLGNLYLKISLTNEIFFEEKVKKNDTTMIVFLMIPLMLFAFFLASINGFIPLAYKSTFLFSYSLLGFSMLIFTAGYYNYLMKRKNMGYNFKMIGLNFSKINFQAFGFNESDINNLKLLYRNRKVENKINNTNLVKNKSTTSYFFLFSLFHVMHKNGIKDLNTTNRKNFLHMLENSFIKINSDSLESGYSKWNQKLKDDENNLKDLTIIRTVFNIK